MCTVTVHCVLCIVYCALCIVQCVLCFVYCALCTVHCILCIVYCCFVYCALYTVHCILCIVYCALCTVHCHWQCGFPGPVSGLPGAGFGKTCLPRNWKNCFDEAVTKLILEGLGALVPRPPKNPVIKPVGEEGGDLSANGK